MMIVKTNTIIKNLKLKFKTPNKAHDFIYIKDVCNAFYKIKVLNTNSVINICTGKLVSNYLFSKIYEKTIKKKILLNFFNKNIKTKGLFGDNTKLKKLKWKQKFDIKKGIKDALR